MIQFLFLRKLYGLMKTILMFISIDDHKIEVCRDFHENNED